MQNLNEPLGSDHPPQARLSCFVFAAGGSSLIWVSVPHSETVFSGFMKVLLVSAHLLMDRRCSGDSEAPEFISSSALRSH